MVWIFLDSDVDIHRRLRSIEYEYLLRMIAASRAELMEFHRAMVNAQLGVAYRMGQLNGFTASQPNSVKGGLAYISDQLGQINQGINELIDLGYEQLDAIYGLQDFLSQAFELTITLLAEQKEILQRISDQLSAPYEMQALELRRQAEKWLKAGMLHQGSDSKDDYADALKLYREAVKNPIGNQDFVVWFQTGWLLWQLGYPITEARDAFHRSVRLGDQEDNPYLPLALRHEAYMHYFLGDYEVAYRRCLDAIKITDTPDTVYEAARYASKAGLGSEAEQFLRNAIRRDPLLMISMQCEVDFLAG